MKHHYLAMEIWHALGDHQGSQGDSEPGSQVHSPRGTLVRQVVLSASFIPDFVVPPPPYLSEGGKNLNMIVDPPPEVEKASSYYSYILNIRRFLQMQERKTDKYLAKNRQQVEYDNPSHIYVSQYNMSDFRQYIVVLSSY